MSEGRRVAIPNREIRMNTTREAVARVARSHCNGRASAGSHWTYASLADAILADLEAEGFVVVPRRPTKAMFSAAHEALVPALDAVSAWDAMIEASAVRTVQPTDPESIGRDPEWSGR